ncbi:MAG: hypothetical protein IPG06_02375 [Haliea sp.]|nr:hypothetical protein [Haliea sp.]
MVHGIPVVMELPVLARVEGNLRSAKTACAATSRNTLRPPQTPAADKVYQTAAHLEHFRHAAHRILAQQDARLKEHVHPDKQHQQKPGETLRTSMRAGHTDFFLDIDGQSFYRALSGTGGSHSTKSTAPNLIWVNGRLRPLAVDEDRQLLDQCQV